ncbi:DeoR/GlpR family DNA-binding transcription regulator [Labrys wisconsinensis]|uniref:DeoR family glycerol-3-phosphate regulon repressor n=1 Tax=Labrys wisconsinensis TaxID=425677 RepID=A0ABU0IYE3_9HYPH|nr:DeoR/GlpR family DNA-binding transcription regulator [Labrys wisconsinensis]MDQ0467033.1 DeoR family glycerol-3-phosphate regulon repressor [Labrys wisconsinensis]
MESTPLALGDQRRMPAQVRHAHLVDAARRRGFFLVVDIAAELGVSEMTIRRDLIELERDGVLVRTRGGAVLTGASVRPAIDREEPAFEARLRKNQEAKRRIAEVAAELVEARQTVALDVGTTTHLLAQRLSERGGLKFFTSSLRTASLLGEAGREVYVPGGQVRGEELSVCGPAALEQFERYWFDIAFIGVSGISTEGMFDYSLEDSELKRIYLRRSAHKVLLCDGAKFHRMSLVKIADFAGLDLMISDVAPPPDIAAALREAGVAVRIVPPPGA